MRNEILTKLRAAHAVAGAVLRRMVRPFDGRDLVVAIGTASLALAGWMAFPPLAPAVVGAVFLYIGLRR